MVYQTSHDDISKSFRDLTAVEGKHSSEVIHVHDQPTTPIVVTTAVRMSAPDVESQEPASTTIINDNDNAGKGMGIAIFVLIIVGTVSAFFLPYISSACYIAALVLASVLTCGCCCAKNYNLKPHVKKRPRQPLSRLSSCSSLVLSSQSCYSSLTCMMKQLERSVIIPQSTAQ